MTESARWLDEAWQVMEDILHASKYAQWSEVTECLRLAAETVAGPDDARALGLAVRRVNLERRWQGLPPVDVEVR